MMMGSPAGGAGGPDKARTFVLPDLYLSLSGFNSSLQTLLQQTLKHWFCTGLNFSLDTVEHGRAFPY